MGKDSILKYIWFCPKCEGYLIDEEDFLHYRDIPKSDSMISKALDLFSGPIDGDEIATSPAGNPFCKCGGPGFKLCKATEEDREYYREERDYLKSKGGKATP